MQVKSGVEIWGGIEYTLNRVRTEYHDQLEYTGHYYRNEDIDTIASLGITTLRYPIIWERHQPQKDTVIDWSFTEQHLHRLQQLNITPIAGLVHHGSGPGFVSFFDGSFEQGLAEYARKVAEKYPWIEYYTPVNEPLTTARFCGLYGHWYPHTSDEGSFYRILLSECKATILAMTAIRKINPMAKLVLTEDLGKTYSTPQLQYQADFDNCRRWLSFDLLCGKVNELHPLWNYLVQKVGIMPGELHYFVQHPCPPDICGLNYYMTSERYLDEDFSKYPSVYHSGNGKDSFADVERVRIAIEEDFGAYLLLKEAYEHLQLPIAITECHLHCTRDEQMRWFNEMWHTANTLQSEGIDIRAITAWALFGTYGWDQLMKEPRGNYETGAFKVTTGYPRPTAFAHLLQSLAAGKAYHHPVLKYEGWWKRDIRCFYGTTETALNNRNQLPVKGQPLLIVGEAGILCTGFSHICFERNLPFVFVNGQTIDLKDKDSVEKLLLQYNPWAIISIEGYEKVDGTLKQSALQATAIAPVLAAACKHKTIKLLSFLPESTKGGTGELLYGEENKTTHLCIYTAIETSIEKTILQANEAALIIRTGKLFSPWDAASFVNKTIACLQQGEKVTASYNRYTSFTYVPDVVHIALDWLLDDESGVFSMVNHYSISEAYLAAQVIEAGNFDKALIQAEASHTKPVKRLIQILPAAQRVKLPYLEDAIQRYVRTVKEMQPEEAVAMV